VLKRILPCLVITYIAGVYMASYDISLLIPLSVSVVLLVLFAILRNRLIKYLVVFSAVLVVSFMHTDIKLNNLPSAPETDCTVTGRVIQTQQEADKSTLLVDTSEYGRVRLSVYGTATFSYGDIILAKTHLYDVKSTYHDGFSRYLMSHRIFIYATADAKDVTILGNRTSPWNLFDVAASVRLFINDSFYTYLPEDTAALASAILLGDRSAIDNATEEIFRISGITHLVAVSGSHLSMLLSLAMGFFGFIHIKRRTPVIVFYIILVWFFVLITGCSFSVIRAAVMCTLVFVAFLIRREADPLSSLSFSVLLLALINPFAIFDIGLQLSALSTASIIIYAPLLNKRLPVFSPIKELITATIAAQIGVLPLSALYFSDISLISPITNIFAVPLSNIAMSLCLLVCLFSPVPFIAGRIGLILSAVLGAFKFIAAVLASVPFASVTAIYPHLRVCLLYIALCITLYLLLTKQKFRAFYTFSLSSCAFCVIIITSLLFSPPQLHFIDVGNGDAILAEDTGVSLLFDGGGSKGYDIAQNKLMPFMLSQSVREIDIAFLTHYHTDHAYACLSLINSGCVDTLVLSGHTSGSEQKELLNSILSAARTNGVKILKVKHGDTVTLGDFSVKVLMPGKDNTLYRLTCNGITTLITGDMTADDEKNLIKKGVDLSCDILKVAHHGSDTSSTEDFLEHTDPDVAVIPVGRNNYGHPSDRVLSRFYKRGIKVYRTDTDGNITFNLNKNSKEFNP